MACGMPSSTDEEFHFRDLLVDLLHKLDDEINQLVLQQLFRVEVGYQKGDVITLGRLECQYICSRPGVELHLWAPAGLGARGPRLVSSSE